MRIGGYKLLQRIQRRLKVFIDQQLFRPRTGAVLVILCGLGLWKLPLGEQWVNTSYDYLFRFGARGVTNKDEVVLILMDNRAYNKLHQSRDRHWSRRFHAALLDKLAADGCRLVVFDVFFGEAGDPTEDEKLAAALRRQRSVVLMAKQEDVAHPGLLSAEPTLPTEPFLSAANKTNWGVAWLRPDRDLIVRHHWPFPAPGPYPSLPWTVAARAGAELSEQPQEQWLRYYGEHDGAWTSLSYDVALGQTTNYFRNKIVFIGNKPETPAPDGERDEFCIPYTRWHSDATGGVEIMTTSFLNLLNGDWLRRPGWWLEALLLAGSGALLGGGLCRLHPMRALGVAAAAALAVTLVGVSLSYCTNFWFPWLVIVGGQVPFALAFSLLGALNEVRQVATGVLPAARPASRSEITPATVVIGALAQASPPQHVPEAPDYELFDPPFGEGAYGKVWLARNAVGQWQALKAVYLSKFGTLTDPYEREFKGIKRYKPISDKHPGLLRVDFVSKKKPEGYFYYVMELGDAMLPGWEQKPALYSPRDLFRMRAQAPGQRLPVDQCARIGLALADALDFLHQQGLTHRDIKPQNIIFVKGLPKLADIGLVTDISPTGEQGSWVGTPGYMPPPPEPPGTPQADIYGLGMVLYVIRSGRDPDFFPQVSTTLVEGGAAGDFLGLNAVILKACQPDRAQRYASAAEMRDALTAVANSLKGKDPAQQA